MGIVILIYTVASGCLALAPLWSVGPLLRPSSLHRQASLVCAPSFLSSRRDHLSHTMHNDYALVGDVLLRLNHFTMPEVE